MRKIKMSHSFELENGREVEVELSGYYSPFRKGDSVGSYYGPSPDEPEEFDIEEMAIVGKHQTIWLDRNHRFFDKLDIGDLAMEYFEDRR